jgi:hypothetical protein
MKNKTLENSEGAIKNGQSKKIGNKTKKNKAKTQCNMYWTPPYTHKHKHNNANKTWALLQITRGNDEPNIIFMLKS